MSRIQCFLLVPTPLVLISLRRYAYRDKERLCVDGRIHDAAVIIGQEESSESRGDRGGTRFPKDDPRWPKVCACCAYEFQDADEWQNFDRLYSGAPDGNLYTLHHDPAQGGAPPGAMWFTPWMDFPGSIYHQQRGGGPHLCCRTPGGDWDIDSKSSNGEGWTREGEPPNVTANPSIGAGRNPDGNYKYHGWLKNGWLDEC